VRDGAGASTAPAAAAETGPVKHVEHANAKPNAKRIRFIHPALISKAFTPNLGRKSLLATWLFYGAGARQSNALLKFALQFIVTKRRL
jgi:hypothetical protein